MEEKKTSKCKNAEIEAIANGVVVKIKYDHYTIPESRIFCSSMEGAFQILRDAFSTNIILKD